MVPKHWCSGLRFECLPLAVRSASAVQEMVWHLASLSKEELGAHLRAVS
jgi:hypothetical protein